jgi:pyruvate,water dikinase
MIPQALEAPAAPVASGPAVRYVQWFNEIGIDDVPLVGGKNASLGEMYRELASAGVKVPNGFAITAEAYRYFLRETGVDAQIKDILHDLDTTHIENLRQRGTRVRHAIMSAEIPADLEQMIVEAYAELSSDAAHPLDVAVRSSATAEDLPDASFAGQQETYLNVQGHEALLHTCRRCFASLFTDRAISYRTDKGFDHHKIALSIGVQRMVRADLGASGVMFTIDTETGFRDAVLINAAYGLGENIVQGSINPDEYYVFKPTLRDGHRPILQKALGTKEFKLIYDLGGGKRVKNVSVPPPERSRRRGWDRPVALYHLRAEGLRHRGQRHGGPLHRKGRSPAQERATMPSMNFRSSGSTRRADGVGTGQRNRRLAYEIGCKG